MSNLDQYSRRPLEARAAYGQQAGRSVPIAAGISVLLGGFMVQFGAAFFAFGMIFCWIFIGLADVPGTVKLLGDKKQASGVVTSVTQTSAKENNSRVYQVDYTFTDSDGVARAGSSYSATMVPAVGQTVDIEFAADDPSTHRIVGMRRGEMPLFVLFVVIFPIVGAVVGVAGLRSGRRKLRLLYTGRTARAKLINKEPTGSSINKRPVYKLTFQFTTPDGRTGQIYDKTHETERVEDEPEELVIYDPDNINDGTAIDALPGGVRMNDAGEITQYFAPRALLLMLLPVGGITLHGLVAVYFLLG